MLELWQSGHTGLDAAPKQFKSLQGGSNEVNTTLRQSVILLHQEVLGSLNAAAKPTPMLGFLPSQPSSKYGSCGCNREGMTESGCWWKSKTEGGALKALKPPGMV